ncbi:MAG: T9SS type A sorting domain-containing protein [Paludibacter sp.]|nr:T9SS type A sorting domain-containing protein [Paludibacter sp.]
MKRNLALWLFFLVIHLSYANPLVSPNCFVLSELSFNSEGKWEIELKFLDDSFYYWGTENIYISSNAGSTYLKPLNLNSIKDKMIVRINNDSLQSNLSINPLGDCISMGYSFTYSLTPPLTFGNLVAATVRTPKNGESIALYGFDYHYDFDFDYSIDKSPSLGSENDSTGMCGTIRGKIYDPYNLLPTNAWLAGNGIIDFKPEANGNYSARITSSKHNIDKLYYFTKESGMSLGYYVKISPVVVTTEPDTIVNVDLHINDIVSSIESIKRNQENIFKIAPNPIKEFSFNYEIAIPVKSSNSYIELFNISGQMVERYYVTESNGRINLRHNLQTGNYTVRLFVNNKNYANSKIIIEN